MRKASFLSTNKQPTRALTLYRLLNSCIMRHFYRLALAVMLLSAGATAAQAQYYEIANQLPSLLQPALSGSMRYKGFVEAGYVKGIGSYNADFLGFSTSQGFQYSSWFFMGVGIGADVLFSHTSDSWGQDWDDWNSPGDFDTSHSSTATGVMIPLFTDFRFNIGGQKGASFFIDLKVGCSFLIGKDYIRINDGYLTNQEYFYLRPSLGVRIPTNSQNPKQAFNIGVQYQLLTSDYWYRYNSDISLNALGVNLSYEW